MTILKRFIDTVHERDSAEPSVFDLLPPDCRWIVSATVELRASESPSVIAGVLAHNGQQIAFVDWSGRHIFSEKLEQVAPTAIRGDRIRLCVSTIDLVVAGISPIDEPDAPPSIAEFREHDPFAGLLSWLPTLI